MAQAPHREVQFFHPHQRVYASGIYRVVHDHAHCEPSDVLFVAGDVFPSCPNCTAVRYYVAHAAPHVSEDADLSGERVSVKAAAFPPTSATMAPKRVFQIAYTESLVTTRELLLQARDYHVDSALGNEAAFRILSQHPPYDLFIVGHAGPSRIREEMVRWLRVNYPAAKILALNPPYQTVHDVDYNVQLDGSPEEWLQVVANAVP